MNTTDKLGGGVTINQKRVKFGEMPPVLKNRVSLYDNSMQGEKREEFEKEVDRWIEDGILVPWKEEVHSGILPLMPAIKQT